MENSKDSHCPNCAELWKRIDILTEEKSKAQKAQGVQHVFSILLFIIILVGFVVKLLTQ